MARVRKINRKPDIRNYYVVDACFLANRFIPEEVAPDQNQKDRIKFCMDWWKEIESQLKKNKARVYIPDICIAEAFKVLAQKFFKESWFKTPQKYNYWKNKLEQTISTPSNEMKKYNRKILYHDIATTRDIIISVDRFFQIFMKNKYKVSLPDLILIATAKYLMDFYDIPRSKLHIVTMDNALRAGTKKSQDLPNAYDPTKLEDRSDRIFIG